ncbi:MAG: hypothetical protein S0880_23400 [Actinomycetota bacterium]|nr:hypothetical protein [Actinomycetota bacterium]
MAEPMTDERLEAVLASVGRHLVTDPVNADGSGDDRSGGGRPVGTLTALPDGRGRRRTSARRVLVAAVALAALASAGLVVAPVREAVAGWFGIGSTRITSGDPAVDATGAVAFLDERYLEALTPDEAEARLGAPLPSSADLGAPDLVAAPAEGGVVLAWDGDAVSLWAHRVPGVEGGALLEKFLFSEDDARSVDGLGDRAAVVRGGHVLVTPFRTVDAAATVLWVEDGVEYRLEADLAPDELVALARSL